MERTMVLKSPSYVVCTIIPKDFITTDNAKLKGSTVYVHPNQLVDINRTLVGCPVHYEHDNTVEIASRLAVGDHDMTANFKKELYQKESAPVLGEIVDCFKGADGSMKGAFVIQKDLFPRVHKMIEEGVFQVSLGNGYKDNETHGEILPLEVSLVYRGKRPNSTIEGIYPGKSAYLDYKRKFYPDTHNTTFTMASAKQNTTPSGEITVDTFQQVIEQLPQEHQSFFKQNMEEQSRQTEQAMKENEELKRSLEAAKAKEAELVARVNEAPTLKDKEQRLRELEDFARQSMEVDAAVTRANLMEAMREGNVPYQGQSMESAADQMLKAFTTPATMRTVRQVVETCSRRPRNADTGEPVSKQSRTPVQSQQPSYYQSSLPVSEPAVLGASIVPESQPVEQKVSFSRAVLGRGMIPGRG